MALPILLVFVATCAVSSEAVSDVRVRLETWTSGRTDLDQGCNESAAQRFAARLQEDPGDLLAAEGFFLACFRICRLDSALALAKSWAPETLSPLGRFRAGERLRATWRLDEAAVAFREAVDLASGRGDSLSVAVAVGSAARSLARASRVAEARPLLERARSAVADVAGVQRLLAELEALDADLSFLEGKYAEADSTYRRLLPEARACGFRQLECDLLNGLGLTLSRRRMVEESVEFLRGAAALAAQMGDRYRWAMALTNVAYDQTQRRELDSALRHLELADSLVQTCGFVNLAGYVQVSLGAVAETRGDRTAALARYRRAVVAHQAAHNESGEMGARQRLAYVLLMMGEYREAIEHDEACLRLGESLDAVPGENWILAGLALAHHKLGHLGRAAEYYERALEVNQALGDRKSVAWCLNSLGMLDKMRGDYRRALLRHHRALAISEELEDSQGLGDALVSLAEVQTRLGDPERAFAHARRAFEVASRDSLEELFMDAVSALAAICAATGRDTTAEAYMRQALDVARRWRDAEATLMALCDLADHCLTHGRAQEARVYLDEASGMLARDGQYTLRSQILLLRSRCAGSPQEAVALATGALQAAVAGSVPEREWQCLSELGLHHLALGDTAAALDCQRRAVDVVESLRRRAGLDELRRHMLRPAIAPYERAVDLLLSGSPTQARIKDALVFAERSHARILAERLRAALAHVTTETARAKAPSPEEEDLLSRLGFRQARLQQPDLSPDERTRLRLEIGELERQQTLARLRESNAAGAPVAAMPSAIDEQALLAVLRPGERLLSYFLGFERSWLITAAAGRLSAHPLAPRDAIEDKTRRFLQLWHQDDSTPLPREVMTAGVRALHEMLLGPVAPEIMADETLVIVPDGLLHRLPFALLGGAGDNLTEAHEIFIAPSLETLRALRQRDAARRVGKPPALDVLAVGCDGARTAPGGAALRVLPFTATPVTALTHARREAQRVAALFPSSQVLVGDAADERSFKRSPLDRCDIVHIAAHGWPDDSETQRSFILLEATTGGGRGASPEDGLLQWHEVAALPLRASLVTLASCRSADGVLAVGEGVTGLTQAFLDAGATCVLAAQSDVPDWLSRQIMETFYVGLRRGLTAAAALRHAQLAALRLPAAAERFLWAGFVLVGDGGVTVIGGQPDRSGTPDAGPPDAATPGVATPDATRQPRRALAETVPWLAGGLAFVAIGCVILLWRRSKSWRGD